MPIEFTILLVVQIIASFSIIVLVLLQQGKGADMGSAFGSGSAGSLFGATGAANFLSRMTKWAAMVFFLATIGLAYIANSGNQEQDTGIMESFQPGQSVPVVPNSVPAAPAGAASSAPAVPSEPAVPGAATGTPANTNN